MTPNIFGCNTQHFLCSIIRLLYSTVLDCCYLFFLPWLQGHKPQTHNKKNMESDAKPLKFKAGCFLCLLQVHHDMTPDELRRVFHVDSHDQGMNINLLC